MGFPVFAPGDILTAADMNAAGWWLMKSDTVAAASSTHICSNAFSSAYTDYLIIIRGLTLTTGSTTAYTMQLRGAGTTATTNYTSAGQSDNYAAATRVVGAASSWYAGAITSNTIHQAYYWISNPQTAARTTAYLTWASEGTTGQVGAFQNSTTQFDSFVLTPGASTFSAGTIRVYGFKA